MINDFSPLFLTISLKMVEGNNCNDIILALRKLHYIYISFPWLFELAKCVALTSDPFASLFGPAAWASLNLPLLVLRLFLSTSFPLVLAVLPFSLSLIINLSTCRTPTPLVTNLFLVAGTAVRLLSGPSRSPERGEKWMVGSLEATVTCVWVG